MIEQSETMSTSIDFVYSEEHRMKMDEDERLNASIELNSVLVVSNLDDYDTTYDDQIRTIYPDLVPQDHYS